MIKERAGSTIELATAALVLGLLFAVPAATLGAIWHNRFFDSVLSGFTAVGMSTPTFVNGLVLIVIFGVKLKLLPTQGYVSFQNHPLESLKTVTLPAITLAIAIAAPIMLILRSSLADVVVGAVHQDRTGQGLPPTIRWCSGTCSRMRRSLRRR